MAHRFQLASLALVTLLACAFSACDGGDGDSGSAGSAGSPTGGTAGNGGNAGSGGTFSTGGNGGNATGGNGTGGNAGNGGSTGTTGTGGNPGGPSVACDDLACPLPDKNCCKNYNEPAACIAPGDDCTYGVPLACDGPEDCQSGEVCCAKTYTKGLGDAYEYTSCAATCTGKDYRVVCGASGQCPQGLTCGTSEMLPPYLDCK